MLHSIKILYNRMLCKGYSGYKQYKNKITIYLESDKFRSEYYFVIEKDRLKQISIQEYIKL